MARTKSIPTSIKGGGGALLREKIVAVASRGMVVIADQSKVVERLGAFPLPVEVNAFGLAATQRQVEIAAMVSGCPGPVTLRMTRTGSPFMTDGGHLILDLALGAIPDANALQNRLFSIPGVVETGLFLKICDRAYIASANGVALRTVSS
jgi:ribose 5-phosphate isomerase A